MVGHAEVLATDQQRAEDEHRALEADHAEDRVGRVGAGGGRKRDDEQQQAERGHADADPLPEADLEAEDPLSHTARITTPVERTACTTDSGA